MDYLDERIEIIQTCLWLEEQKLIIGTWGNVSIRLPSGNILLTPSKLPYHDMKPEDLVIVNEKGEKCQGTRSATSEMDVHRLIYLKRPDISAIIHCHPLYASAMCATGQGIPPILEEMTQLLGGEVPITSQYIRAGHHLELAKETARALGDKNAVLIANHAPVCCGRNLDEARTCCLVTEKAAACYLSIKGNLPVKPIPQEDILAERNRFLYQYGHEN